MKSIILYPENDRYVLKRIFKIFNSQQLKVDASKINRDWNIEQLNALYSVLNIYSHVIIVLSSEYIHDTWLIGLLGYLRGSSKCSYFYFTEENIAYHKIFNNFKVGHGYESVETYAEIESERWSLIQKKEQARNDLINNGFALSDEAMGETIISGQIEIVQKYIEAGFSCSARNSKGVPMLCLSVRNRHINISKLLIETGADINAISEDRNNTPIMDASAQGDLDSIKILVAEGADLEVQSKNGQTALILSVGNGDVEVSNYLLSAGANYEVKDFLGMSAKGYATLFHKEEILVNMK